MPHPFMRTRFAPSPTGYLHLGHALSADWGRRRAELFGGEWLLRIEDIDTHRCHPRFSEAIIEDLRWLGFDWPEPVLVQSADITPYQDALHLLVSAGLTWSEPKNEHAHYKISLDLDACLELLGERVKTLGYWETGPKLNNQAAFFEPLDCSLITDTTIARRDIGLSYALCVTIDDSHQAITEVVRGHDLRDATHFHVLLQALLDLPTPHYHHHPLINDDQGRKLAKSRGSSSIRDEREKGIKAQDVLELAYGLIDPLALD